MSAIRDSSACDDPFVDEAFTVAAGAYVGTAGSWAEAVHAALGELLEFLAASPDRTRRAVLAPVGGGTPELERLDGVLERFAEFFEPGYAEAADPPVRVVAEAITGGIYELIRIHVGEDRIEALPEALPASTLLALAPFVGDAEAERLAATPIPVRVDR